MDIIKLSQVNKALGVADIDQLNEDEQKRLDFYDKGCFGFSNDETNYNIPNDDEMRSQITSSHLFRTTGKKLFIYTNGFRKNINNDKFNFIKNLVDCLSKCEIAEIIVDEHFATNVTLAIANAQKDRPNNIRLYKAREGTKQEISQVLLPTIKQEKKPFNIVNPEFHFILGDGSKFRLEYNGANKLAKVNYNDPINTNALESVFNIIKNKSTPFVYEP